MMTFILELGAVAVSFSLGWLLAERRHLPGYRALVAMLVRQTAA